MRGVVGFMEGSRTGFPVFPFGCPTYGQFIGDVNPPEGRVIDLPDDSERLTFEWPHNLPSYGHGPVRRRSLSSRMASVPLLALNGTYPL